jgi:hypothetical protein
MRGYAERQGRRLDEGRIGAAMTWSDPVRDVSRPREIALRLIDSGHEVHCVWSGRRLDYAGYRSLLSLDGVALWRSLEPTACTSSRKSAREAGRAAIRGYAPSRPSRDRCLVDLGISRQRRRSTALALRPGGTRELPGLGVLGDLPEVDDVFTSMGLQRLRLRQDQQVPEWTGL